MNLTQIIEENQNWNGCKIPDEIPHGDMPGDKVQIEDAHIKKSEILFQELLRILPEYTKKSGKIVISVCGGSGVGKSETASLLTYYFNQLGITSYTLSGDNYPHRIPKYNDAERLQVYREGGVQGLARKGILDHEMAAVLQKLQLQNLDSDEKKASEYTWLRTYQESGAAALMGYLGTEKEIGFQELSEIVKSFKAGQTSIYLRRMGRTESELWYDLVDFSNVKILVIEWTHGNSEYLQNVDISILLNSTPEETLAHRKARNRDGAVDSPFTQLVLRLEQEKLKSQANRAKIILSKEGEILDYDKYCEIMGEI